MMGLPKPFVPEEVDLRSYVYMPLEVGRLRDSDTAASVSGEAFRAAVLLWCAAWHQLPAASLPDNDIALARLAGFGRHVEGWQAVTEEALCGFTLCSDDRLYHATLAEIAMSAWKDKKRQRDRTAAATAALQANRGAANTKPEERDDDRNDQRNAERHVNVSSTKARSQYKAMKTIEPLVEKSTTGDVSPAGLMQAVRSSYGGMAYGGGGPLGDLARVGQRFLKEPPSSGTAERLQAGENVGKVKDTIGTLGAAALGADKAAPYLAPYVSPEMILPTLASMGGGFAAGRAASAVLRSPAVANMLVQRALGAQPAANPLLAGISAGAPMVAGPTVNRLLLPPPGRAATP